MKMMIFILLSVFFSFQINAQDITGTWNGELEVSGMKLRLVFHIKDSNGVYSSTMDSPDQGAHGIPVEKTSFENGKLKIEIPKGNLEYNGELKGDSIVGNLTQRGMEFAINLSRKAIEKPVVIRPQEPIPPYPYYSEEVVFENKNANITLAGTLTLPKKEGNYPVVILITGSGPQNRDEEIFGHKPFLVIADYLTRHGIGVLRYDDRGVGKSKGVFSTSTSADFASDVKSAIQYLKTRKDINVKKIGLIGHSEGGMIAPMVASESKDVSFIVLLAGPGIPIDQLMLLQKKMIEKKMGVADSIIANGQEMNKGAYEIIKNSKNDTNLKEEVNHYFANFLGSKASEKQVEEITDQIITPWWIYFLRYNPVPVLEKVKCPVLALNGENDVQVPYQENLKGIQTALIKGGNKAFTILPIPHLNHLFQESKTGLPQEYPTIEQTFSPIALEAINQWIQKQVK
jgi:hypothetical protein